MAKNDTLNELKNKASGNFRKTKTTQDTNQNEQLLEQVSQLEAKLEISNKQLEEQITVGAKWEYIAKKATADLQNVLTQHNIDLANRTKVGKKSVALGVLPFLNTLRLAFTYLPPDLDSKTDKFVNTLKSSFEKVIGDLSLQNITIIAPQVGDDFDSAQMSALSATNDEHKVTQIVELGMIIDGQIVRPASVMC